MPERHTNVLETLVKGGSLVVGLVLENLMPKTIIVNNLINHGVIIKFLKIISHIIETIRIFFPLFLI